MALTFECQQDILRAIGVVLLLLLLVFLLFGEGSVVEAGRVVKV